MISLFISFLVMVVVGIRTQIRIYSLKSEIENLCRIQGFSWPFWSDIEFFARFAFLPKSALRRLSGSEAIEKKVKDLIEVRKGWLKFILIWCGIWILLNVLEILVRSALE